MRKEQIVLWGSVFLVFIVIVLIVFSGGENNYLNPSGNRNPANQKLMVVDQDTGEISFIQKSLQGVNQDRLADDKIIKDALVLLLGENLKGDTSGFIYDERFVRRPHEDEKYATKEELAANRKLDDQRLASLEGSIDKKIDHGAGIRIEWNDGDGKWRTLGTHNCDPRNSHKEPAQWCDNAMNNARIVRW